ncbi:PREDICTED: uncharacterized protein LOC109584429 isoform X5 [Amphimedon queenslandica]|uniref:Fibronectin type-III domain-containing protein n=1 Tax=Amphimedon queenslandica TaxID=400682 RepID=A0AAN0JFC9_AMPQE|nr:PREDICTED: uncharacterized protein LOC109584429 isoform X5 [Amphimedon queenslandica]|eukprot:XP_019855745.1 PREDICTED: uncharacterized protein LOC109584429 isoform X5 [Amphimedon queenslandica]
MIMASALLLGLILVCTGITDGAITNFTCTDGPVCAGDRIECSCTTDTGTLEWFVKYSPVESLMWNQIPQVSFHAMNTEDKEFYGYNFTFNTTYTGLNTSILTFNLNHSQSVLIECANGQETDKMNTTVTDLGYYAKAPTNLTTTFNASRITLEWEDTGNNCTSTEYQVTVISCSCTSTSVLTYSTNDTALHINSRDLLDNITYTYTVRGWNEQQSNNSKPFTLSNDAITFQCESPQNNNDLAFNVTITANSTTDDCSDSCCTNITISIRLVLNTSDPQYANLSYNISYDSITGIEESMVKSEGEWNKFIQLPRNETHYFDSRQAKNQCSELGNPTCSNPMENSGNIGNIVAIILGIILFVFIALALMACCLVKQIRDKIKEKLCRNTRICEGEQREEINEDREHREGIGLNKINENEGAKDEQPE